MKIEWLGHSCFLLTTADGTRILTDPFDPKMVGYPALDVAADIVTVSHQHGDHNYTQAVRGKFTLVDKPGVVDVHGVTIKGVPTFHDDAGGAQRGKNIVFRFSVDDLNLVHCGDLGHLLNPAQVAELLPVDVILLPVGGHFTIDAAAAQEVVKALKPALVIPMHYKTPSLNFPITTEEPFLKSAGGWKKAGTRVFEVSREDLASKAGVVVLEPPK